MTDTGIEASGEAEPELTVAKQLIEVAAELGFAETPELVQIRAKFKPDQLYDESRDIMVEYQKLAEEILSTNSKTGDIRSQLGFLVAFAAIKNENGFMEEFREDLRDAFMYAHHVGEDDICKRLRKIAIGIELATYETRELE